MKFNPLSNLNWNPLAGLWDIVADFLAIIPKVIYFVFASISSCVDAMQALVRKLAGLDVYYQAGEAITNTDPLTEFIYGILGVGENAVIYKALNTVFWSLAVFGLIVLVVSTIIAIIKSHYNEDTAQTSPWKYIYQAIKAIFTFAIVPFAVIFGMQLSTLLLTTLDKIIAGSGQEGEIVVMYGSDVAGKFKSDNLAGNEDIVSYIHYDYFGEGGISTSSTFSGMLFKASTYSCNRARTGSVSYENFQLIVSGQTPIFGNSSCTNFANLTSTEDKQEYVATQIDYAFANHLVLTDGLSYSQTQDATGIGVFALADIFSVGKKSINSFSKFDIGAIWQFYNLWSFNFVLAFAGAFSTFAIMISIILGLMTRLLKGAALFLVYPALLGLAPMDNFKAFKSWAKDFIGQILMAMGSIVGINLMLLILPFIQLITFFDVGLIDNIVNLIILITGLMMAKDFMSMITSFVGGGQEAFKVGEGMKGSVSGALKKGIGMTAKVGLGTARVMGAVGAKGIKLGKKAVQHGSAAWRANRREKKESELKKNAATASSNLLEATDSYNTTLNARNASIEKFITEAPRGLNPEKQKEYQQQVSNVGQKAYDDYLKENLKVGMKKEERDKVIAEANNIKYDAMAAEVQKIGYNKIHGSGAMKLNEQDLAESKKNLDVAKTNAANAERAKQKNEEKKNALVEKYGLTRDDNGNFKGKGLVKTASGAVVDTAKNIASNALGLGKNIALGINKAIDSASIGKSIADVFTKTVQEMGSGLGIDKAVTSAKDILGTSLTFKGGYTNKELSGDKLQKDIAKKEEKATKEQTEVLKEILKKTQEQNDRISELSKKSEKDDK